MDILTLLGRYLLTRRIALVAALFVALAVAAMIVVTSVMDGFRSRIHETVRGVEPDLAIRMSRPVRQHFQAVEEDLASELVSAGGDIVALDPRLETVGFLTSGQGAGSRREGVRLLGIDFGRCREVIPLQSILEAPRSALIRTRDDLSADPLNAQRIAGIFVGVPLARRLMLTTAPAPALFGLEVTGELRTGRVEEDPAAPEGWRVAGSNLTVRLAGAFDSGRDDFDLTHVFVDRFSLLDLRFGPASDHPDCTVVHARLSEGARSRLDAAAKELRERHPGLIIETWKDRNRGLMDALDVEKGAMALVLGFIVMLTIALILGLLYMMVVEKTRDIGVLRSMGLSRSRVVLLFFCYGGVLGVLGTTLGVGLGVTLVNHLDGFVGLLGLEVFNPDVPYRFRGIPAVLSPSQVAWIAGATLLLTMLAGAVAARRAATVDPVRCLRYE